MNNNINYHINSNGEIAICKAKKNNCRFGNNIHFKDINEAQLYADRINEYISISELPIELARKEFIQKDIYKRKKDIRQLYSFQEAMERAKYVEEKVEWARNKGLSSDFLYSDGQGNWSIERTKIHNKIIRYLLLEYKDVPNEGKVVFSSGISGAGKTTILSNHSGIDLTKYAFVSSDDIKEIMAKEGLIPEVDGLTQMEASSLVHEESSYIADRLLKNLANLNQNIIYDCTGKTTNSITDRIKLLNEFEYSNKNIKIFFVDIPLHTSKDRIKNRYMNGLNRFDIGGRWVPSFVTDKQKSITNKFNSLNAENIVNIIERKDLNLSKPIIFDNKDSYPIKINYDEFKRGYK